MEINVHDNEKLVDIWLSNSEKDNPELREQLKPLYKKYHEKKYLVVVYESGRGDLSQSVLEMLKHNRTLFAEQEVQQEKIENAGKAIGMEL